MCWREFIQYLIVQLEGFNDQLRDVNFEYLRNNFDWCYLVLRSIRKLKKFFIIG